MTCSCALSGQIPAPEKAPGREAHQEGKPEGKCTPRGLLHVSPLGGGFTFSFSFGRKDWVQFKSFWLRCPRFFQCKTHVMLRPCFFEFLKDQRKRAAELEKERARKRAAYAKKMAELQEYKQALTWGQVGQWRWQPARWNSSIRVSGGGRYLTKLFKKRSCTHVIYCEINMSLTRWTLPAKPFISRQLSGRTFPSCDY